MHQTWKTMYDPGLAMKSVKSPLTRPFVFAIFTRKKMLLPSLHKDLDHVFGCSFAPIQIVAYGNFQCPVSAKAYGEIKFLQEVMGSQLLYAYRHYPDPFLHPLSLDAAVASEVAATQGEFWTMHDALFESPQSLTRPALVGIGNERGIDMSRFNDSVEYRRLARKVILDFSGGVKSGVNRTPAFFINGIRFEGKPDFIGLFKACRYLLLLTKEVSSQAERSACSF